MRTEHTRDPVNNAVVEDFIEQFKRTPVPLESKPQQTQSSSKKSDRSKGKSGDSWTSPSKKGKGRKVEKQTSNRNTKATSDLVLSPNKHGQVVGSNAPQVGESNVGHILLSKMGWTPGQSLGKDGQGIAQPISAVMRDKRRGLGS